MPQVSVAHRLAYIAVGIVLGSVLVSTQSDRSQTSYEEKTTKSLSSFLGSLRLTEGRLTGQVAYAPYPTSSDRKSADKRLVRESARRQDSSPGARERAMELLAQGQLDAAITELEAALQISPGDAGLLSDLSALYGERGQAGSRPELAGSTYKFRAKSNIIFWPHLIKSPEDFVTALELAERAVSIDPNLPVAVFNQAVALERLFLDQQAVEAWRRYLQLDGTSPWAGEARQRIYRLDNTLPSRQDLQEQMLGAAERGYQGTVVTIAASDHQTAREIFEEDLLPRWADAIAGEDQERAKVLLESAQDIADQFAFVQGGDRIFQKIGREMNQITSQPASRQKSFPLVQYLQLQARAGASDLDTAGVVTFDEAAQALETTSSPLGLLIRFRRAERLYRERKYAAASSELLRLQKDSRLPEYPSLDARLHSLAGSIAQRQQALTDALEAYLRALDLYRKAGEWPNTAATQTLIATCLDALGQPSEAWKYRYQALAWSKKRPARSRLPIVTDLLETGVAAALSQRHPQSALRLQAQLVRITYALDDPEEIVRALLGCARIKAGLALDEQARRDFNQAVEELQRVPLSAREKLAAQIDVTRTDLAEFDDRLGKIAGELRDPAHPLTAQADFYFEQGNTAAAEEYLRRALDELEHRRDKVDSNRWEYQVSFLDQSRALYERMVALQLHLGKPQQALETLERFRARALLDRWQRLSDQEATIQVEDRLAAPLSWQEISRRVPADTVIVVYGVVEERLVTWLVRRQHVELIPQQTVWASVAPLVDGLYKRGPRAQQSVLSLLYQRLVAPWRDRLAPEDRIVFVPASSLYNVPFAALFDQQTGKFLIQDHALSVAQSASEFLSATERDRQLSSRPLSEILLVSDPLEDDSAYPSLPGAKKEIAALENVYANLNVRSLTRSEATPGRIMNELGRADMVHFSVHGLSDRADPNRAFLKVSPEDGRPGLLTVRDVLGLRLDRTRLVVLASCETQAGRVSASEGSLNLAYSFLAAGVPAIVGSLWYVDDQSTARLSIRFHQELSRGADAVSALRTAQLEELSAYPDEDHWTWAIFQVFGGVATRPSIRSPQDPAL